MILTCYVFCHPFQLVWLCLVPVRDLVVKLNAVSSSRSLGNCNLYSLWRRVNWKGLVFKELRCLIFCRKRCPLLMFNHLMFDRVLKKWLWSIKKHGGGLWQNVFHMLRCLESQVVFELMLYSAGHKWLQIHVLMSNVVWTVRRKN